MKLYAALYQLAIYAYFAAIRLAAFFNNKARLFITGREDIFSTIEARMKGDGRQSIWMHCASLGEFEQGRPALEALRAAYPQYAAVVTFFSPSGYEVRKDYEGADYVFYLTMDSAGHAKKLLGLFNPALCIFVKYEFWYFYLSGIAAQKIPAILISAVFNDRQWFFKWYGGLQRHMLRCFTHIFVQDKNSVALLQRIGIENVTVSGDTRFDRVIKAAAHTADFAEAAAFCEGFKVIVAGSTWKEDEALLQKALGLLPPVWKLIIAPHEVDKEHIADIKKLFGGKAALWTEAGTGQDMKNSRVLIADKMGILLKLYRYGTVAWIGGGFGKEGVHNVLEAAVYGMPCFYGPIYHQFIEAEELIEKGGAFAIKDAADLATSIRQMDDIRYGQHAALAKKYVHSRAGATEKVVSWVKHNTDLQSRKDDK